MNYKKDFPIFRNNPSLIYLDSAATSQKPEIVIEAVRNFYRELNSNVHRGLYDLSIKATEAYESTRAKIAKFIGADKSSEIVFTGNATEAINLVVIGYAQKNLKKGDIVVLTEMEHNSNLAPWIILKKKLKLKIIYLPIDSDYRLKHEDLSKHDINLKKVKIISLTHASNVLGTINPLEKIIHTLRKECPNAKFLIDATQSIAHMRIDVKKLCPDFLVFSGHKMFGPSGIGILWAKENLLEEMDPIFVGAHMVDLVTKENVDLTAAPQKFEAGTGKLEAVVGLGSAIDYINLIGYENIGKLDYDLTEYGLKVLSKIKGVKLYGSKNSKDRLPIFSFNLLGIHPHDVSEILNRYKICVRSGHHCAQVLLRCLNTSATLRASLSIYNSKSDIDKLAEGIEKAKKIFNI